MGIERARGIQAKLDRAKKHIAELNREIGIFLDGNHYAVSPYFNADTRHCEWILDRADEIPIAFSAIVGECLQNIRSALDYLIWQLVIANNGSPKSGVTGFPIANDFHGYCSANFKRKITGVRPDIVTAIDQLKPYKGGNDLLWQLHSLNNMDKHRLLLSAASAVTHRHVLPTERQILSYFTDDPAGADLYRGVFIPATNARFPPVVGEVCLSIRESEMENDFTFRMGISFNEPGIVVGEPILETVQQFFELASEIASRFEADL
jgi:hypothetical protein